MPRRTSPLKLEPKGDAKELKKLLKDSPVVILVVFANWCGHCQTMKKNIWDPMCKRKNVSPDHVAAVESSVLESAGEEGKAILNKVEGFPTVMKVVNGRPVESYPPPQNVQEMENIVKNATNVNTNTKNNVIVNKNTNTKTVANREATPFPSTPVEMTETPEGYTPEDNILTRYEREQKQMIGGSLYDTMRHISSGILPAGLTSFSMRAGGRRIKKQKQKQTKRKTRKTRKMRKTRKV